MWGVVAHSSWRQRLDQRRRQWRCQSSSAWAMSFLVRWLAHCTVKVCVVCKWSPKKASAMLVVPVFLFHCSLCFSGSLLELIKLLLWIIPHRREPQVLVMPGFVCSSSRPSRRQPCYFSGSLLGLITLLLWIIPFRREPQVLVVPGFICSASRPSRRQT